MAASDEMTIDERRKYLAKVAPRYHKATRQEQSRLLDEMGDVTGMHRKSLLRLLHASSLERLPRRGGRGRVYGAATEDVIRVVWESLDYVCVERLTPALLPTARHLAGFGELRLTAEVEQQLASISRATVGRLLERLRQDTPRLPRRGPEQANRVRREVPMRRIPWDTADPGHLEVDLVHHAGGSAAGDYVHTLQMVDVATGWSERAAVLGRSQEAMEGGFRRVLARLPFPVKELHPDNGPEFFNDHLVRFFGEAITGLTLSRSRPYRKNDNRFVEQKTPRGYPSLVRAYFGTARLETPAQRDALNELYDQMRIFYNLFQPVLHLASKEVVEGKLKRRWDEAQTPYERLLATGVLPDEVKQELARLHATTNPRRLRHAIHAAIPGLWDLPAHPSRRTRVA
ncbi:MAG: integrase [Chloroflexi bacterium]|nr:integrase [Chloroflexota bacterium]